MPANPNDRYIDIPRRIHLEQGYRKVQLFKE